MRPAALVVAALLAGLPAAAETLTAAPVVVELRKWCIAERRMEAYEPAAPYCNCVMGEAWRWATAEGGSVQQSRLWTIMFEVLPDSVTTDEAYARVEEAGLERGQFDDDMIENYRALDTFYAACVPPAD